VRAIGLATLSAAVLSAGLVYGCARRLTYVGSRRVPQEALKGLHSECREGSDCNAFQVCLPSKQISGASCEIPCERAPGVFDDNSCPAPAGCIEELTTSDLPAGYCYGAPPTGK
jgi:hypothetical protein